MWEFDVFRGYYCGVCKSIGKQAGHAGRVILSYDTAFLALLLDSLRPEPVNGKPKRCFVHPLKKRFMVTAVQVSGRETDVCLWQYSIEILQLLSITSKMKSSWITLMHMYRLMSLIAAV